jgi:HD-GYP domain-containing protein (c-di-GMP phosphodiesterase class II)
MFREHSQRGKFQPGSLRGIGGWALLLLLPLLVLLAFTYGLVPDPRIGGAVAHVWIVTLTALAMGGIAALMTVAAFQVREARVFFLALTFISIAGIFLNHALTTPSAIVRHSNPWVGFSAALSLFLGAFFLKLTTVEWSDGVQRWIVTHQRTILASFLALLIAYNAVALITALMPPAAPVLHDGGAAGGHAAPTAPAMSGGIFVALAGWPLKQLLGWITIALHLLVIRRYLRLYRTSRGPLISGLLASSIFLAQAQLVYMTTPIWHVSWWQYHTLMVAAFGAAAVGLGREYLRSGSIRAVMEGLFLRDTIVQIERGYADVIVALVSAIEARDPNTRGHSQRVAELAVLIGQELRLSPEQLRVVSQAAILHDIGKIAVPDAILNKPGRLTDAEFSVIKQHPVRGYEIIKGVRSLQRELGGVRSHHERLDGSGYPDGLVGDAIPLEARIIAVADIYDALTASRTYRDAWAPAQALAAIDADAGIKLDEHCIMALHSALARLGVPLLEIPEARRKLIPLAFPVDVHTLQIDDALLPGDYAAAD